MRSTSKHPQRAQRASTASTDDLAQATFARSTGLPPQMGKATSELRCKVPDVVKDDFVRMAHALGMTEGEFLRLRVMVILYGEGEVQSMYRRHVSMVAGMGSESAPEASL